MKEIIFGGDSFIWGEGLEFFTDSSLFKEFINNKDVKSLQKFVSENTECIEFREKNRFSQLVANNYNTKCHVYDRNGGDNYSCLDELIYLIKNTNLDNVSNIIFQPTSLFRSLDIGNHPINTTFLIPNQITNTTDWSTEKMDTKPWVHRSTCNDFSEISNHSTKKWPLIGNGIGFDKFKLKKNILSDEPHHYEKFNVVNNDLDKLIRFCIELENPYREYSMMEWVKESNLNEYFEGSDSDYYNILDENTNLLHDFLLTEYSDYGTNAIDIYDGIENKLMLDLVEFIKCDILPLINNLSNHTIDFKFLQTWCIESERWETLEDSFFQKNYIKLPRPWKDMEPLFEIAKTPGFEWTQNLHPNIEGHHWFANSIIKYLDNQ